MLDIAHALVEKISHIHVVISQENASAGAIETSDLTLGKWLI
jgi:hypothetical protein